MKFRVLVFALMLVFVSGCCKNGSSDHCECMQGKLASVAFVGEGDSTVLRFEDGRVESFFRHSRHRFHEGKHNRVCYDGRLGSLRNEIVYVSVVEEEE